MPRQRKGNGNRANDDLSRYVERLEALETERRAAADAIAELLEEARDNGGYHKGALREIVRRRLETAEQRTKRALYEDALDQMRARLGELADLPLGQVALAHNVDARTGET